MTMMAMADSLGLFHVRAEGKCSIDFAKIKEEIETGMQPAVQIL